MSPKLNRHLTKLTIKRHPRRQQLPYSSPLRRRLLRDRPVKVTRATSPSLDPLTNNSIKTYRASKPYEMLSRGVLGESSHQRALSGLGKASLLETHLVMSNNLGLQIRLTISTTNRLKNVKKERMRPPRTSSWSSLKPKERPGRRPPETTMKKRERISRGEIWTRWSSKSWLTSKKIKIFGLAKQRWTKSTRS